MQLISAILLSLILVGAEQCDLKDFSNGNNQFTAAVYKELLNDDKENVIVSPLSVQIVLAAVQAGAKGKTAEELQKTLHLPSCEKTTNNTFKTLFTSLKGNDLSTLYTANKIYVKKDLSIKKSFKELINDIFKADLESLDFTQSDNAANIINKWVEQQTKNKIKNLISPTNLGPTTSLILVNTMYFKAKWFSTFEPHYTRKEKFYKSAENVIEVDGMYMHRAIVNYYECPELKSKILKKKFADVRMSMVFVLPNDIEGLKDVENQTEKVFAPHLFEETRVNVMLPKFKIETKTVFSEILKKLGVEKAFLKDQADFSGIIEKGDSLIISEIVQKAFIEVNEDGVEVAVATDLEVTAGSSLQKNKPKEFIADHPFLYYIQFENVVLFAGKVSAPTY